MVDKLLVIKCINLILLQTSIKSEVLKTHNYLRYCKQKTGLNSRISTIKFNGVKFKGKVNDVCLCQDPYLYGFVRRWYCDKPHDDTLNGFTMFILLFNQRFYILSQIWRCLIKICTAKILTWIIFNFKKINIRKFYPKKDQYFVYV